jgi:cob(I)alamin adenosyltransferase
MANRLTGIVTRTGDDGSTGLADGRRVAKHSARIHAIGSVDELNCHLGVLLTESLAPEIRQVLLRVQNDLFDLGGALALPETTFDLKKLHPLDNAIEKLNAKLPPLKEFILPGGSRSAALSHVARAVTRRAERDLAALAQSEITPEHALPYLNRLSDLLFILCRVLNQAAEQEEILWQRISPS